MAQPDVRCPHPNDGRNELERMELLRERNEWIRKHGHRMLDDAESWEVTHPGAEEGDQHQ